MQGEWVRKPVGETSVVFSPWYFIEWGEMLA